MEGIGRSFVVGAAVAGALLSGCGAEEAWPTEAVDEQRDPIYFYNNVTYFTSNDWTVPVCFLIANPTDLATERGIIQDTVFDQWSTNTKLNFTGLGQCPASPSSATVPIQLVSSPGALGAGGITAPGMGRRLPSPNSNAQIRITYPPNRNGLRNVAVHEMGHALGLVHEHQRPDSDPATAQCVSRLPSQVPGIASSDLATMPGHRLGSEIDPKSIMSYCRDWDSNGTPDLLEARDYPALSQLDKAGMGLLYGTWDEEFVRENGFAWVHDLAGTNGTIDAPATHSWNSYGLQANRLTRTGTGVYRVEFPKVGYVPGAHFQVSTFGSNRRCKVGSFTRSGSTDQAEVRCFSGSSASDSQFLVSFVNRNNHYYPHDVGGYTYADQHTASGTYTPQAQYTWNVRGLPVTVTRNATGVYTVEFSGVAAEASGDHGTAQVTAVGTGSEHCKVGSLTDDSDLNMRVSVYCFNSSGSAANSRFFVSFARKSVMDTPSYAYALANQPTTSSYTPLAPYQKTFVSSTCGSPIRNNAITVARAGTGRYTVTVAGFPTQESFTDLNTKLMAKVTAYGTTSEHCNVSSWTPGLTSTAVGVDCFRGTTAADSSFMITMTSTFTDNCL